MIILHFYHNSFYFYHNLFIIYFDILKFSPLYLTISLVSIKFVVQNLKNQLVTIGRLKNYFRNNLVFQADMFEQLWITRPQDKPVSLTATASEDVSLSKQMIYETDEIEKNLLKNAFKLVTSTFKIKGYQ